MLRNTEYLIINYFFLFWLEFVTLFVSPAWNLNKIFENKMLFCYAYVAFVITMSPMSTSLRMLVSNSLQIKKIIHLIFVSVTYMQLQLKKVSNDLEIKNPP